MSSSCIDKNRAQVSIGFYSNNMQGELLPLSRPSKEFNVSIARSFSISRLKNTTDCSPIESP